MKRITRWYSVRHYWAKGDEDDFCSFPKLSDVLAIELLAYYRGEPVTDWMIDRAREEVCKEGSERPLPIVSLGRMKLICTDGVYDKYDLGTLLRHFELVSNLYELDPTIREMKIPFSMSVVESILISERWWREDVVELLKFLLPKSVDNFLYISWHGRVMKKDFARFIGSGMSKESRMNNSELAGYVPDWDLYPVVSWAYRMSKIDILRELLLPDYPSVYLKCLLDKGGYTYADEILALITTSKFQDILPVEGTQAKWRSYLDDERFVEMMEVVNDADDLRYLLAAFGLRHELLNNEDITTYTPFGVKALRLSKNRANIMMEKLLTLDSTFIKGNMELIMKDYERNECNY